MRVAILHEGNAGKSEDNELLKRLLADQNLDVERVEFYGMGTKNNFFDPDCKDYRALIPRIETDQISKVLFTLDADFQKNDQTYGGYDNSLTALKAIAHQLKIHQVSQYYIFCDPASREGNVESLLLATLDPKKKACIDDFLKCSDFKDKENAKAVLHRIYYTAYPEPPYNFQHAHFDELKKALNHLFS